MFYRTGLSIKHLDEILIATDTNEITELNIKYTHKHTLLYAYTCTFIYIYVCDIHGYTYIHIPMYVYLSVFIHTYTIQYIDVYMGYERQNTEFCLFYTSYKMLYTWSLFFHKGKCFSLLPVEHKHGSVRGHSSSHHLRCDASDQKCFSITIHNRLRVRPFLSDPSILRQRLQSGALAPPSPSLAADTQLFGYLSGASIKGCHSASRCP